MINERKKKGRRRNKIFLEQGGPKREPPKKARASAET